MKDEEKFASIKDMVDYNSSVDYQTLYISACEEIARIKKNWKNSRTQQRRLYDNLKQQLIEKDVRIDRKEFNLIVNDILLDVKPVKLRIKIANRLLEHFDNKQYQIKSLEKTFELACKTILEIVGNCPYDHYDLEFPKDCDEQCGKEMERFYCWDKYFKTKAKEMKSE